MSIDNHQMTCGKRDKNPNQPINSPFTSMHKVRIGVLNAEQNKAIIMLYKLTLKVKTKVSHK